MTVTPQGVAVFLLLIVEIIADKLIKMEYKCNKIDLILHFINTCINFV